MQDPAFSFVRRCRPILHDCWSSRHHRPAGQFRDTPLSASVRFRKKIPPKLFCAVYRAY